MKIDTLTTSPVLRATQLPVPLRGAGIKSKHLRCQSTGAGRGRIFGPLSHLSAQSRVKAILRSKGFYAVELPPVVDDWVVGFEQLPFEVGATLENPTKGTLILEIQSKSAIDDFVQFASTLTDGKQELLDPVEVQNRAYEGGTFGKRGDPMKSFIESVEALSRALGAAYQSELSPDRTTWIVAFTKADAATFLMSQKRLLQGQLGRRGRADLLFEYANKRVPFSIDPVTSRNLGRAVWWHMTLDLALRSPISGGIACPSPITSDLKGEQPGLS